MSRARRCRDRRTVSPAFSSRRPAAVPGARLAPLLHAAARALAGGAALDRSRRPSRPRRRQSRSTAGNISGLVAGPLFSGWDAARGRAADGLRAAAPAALGTLQSFTASTGLPVVDVEARPRAVGRRRARWRRRWRRWASSPGSRRRRAIAWASVVVEPVPRRVLVLLDGAEEPYLPYAVAHRMLAVPLEYLGFAVDYADVRAGLPDAPLADRYAGLVTWFTDDEMPAADRYERWLARQIDGGAARGDPRPPRIHAIAGACAAGWGCRRCPAACARRCASPAADEMVGFEAPPAPRGARPAALRRAGAGAPPGARRRRTGARWRRSPRGSGAGWRWTPI